VSSLRGSHHISKEKREENKWFGLYLWKKKGERGKGKGERGKGKGRY